MPNIPSSSRSSQPKKRKLTSKVVKDTKSAKKREKKTAERVNSDVKYEIKKIDKAFAKSDG